MKIGKEVGGEECKEIRNYRGKEMRGGKKPRE